MKIAFINHDAGAYGATKSLLDLIEGLMKWGVTCYVIVPKVGPFPRESPFVKELEQRAIEYAVIDYRHWVHQSFPNPASHIKRLFRRFPNNGLYRAYKNWRAISIIKSRLQDWTVDAIYTNTSVVPIGALVALRMKKPHIWHIREFQQMDQGLALDWGKPVFRWLLNKSTAVVLISQAVKRYYTPLLRNPKSYVVYNGVAPMVAFNQMKERTLPARSDSNCYTFCIVGRVIPQKGQAEAIKAVGELAKVGIKAKLLVAGRGNYEPLRALAVQLCIQDQIDFMGHTDDPFSVYLQSDACLVCSWHEAFGRVTIEAMVAGLPVIGKKNEYSGTQELIRDFDTGLLYEGGESALANCMKQLVENPEWGRTLGERAWKYAQKHYHQEKYVDQIYNILKKHVVK